MYSYGPPHMAKQKQDDQLEHTCSSYVRIQDVALKTCQRRWTIGRSGERESRISVLVARHDDDDTHIKKEVFSLYRTETLLWTRHAGHYTHCWRSRDELISDVLLWTPAYGQAKAGRPARIYIHKLWEDTGCSLEDLPEAMNNKKWRERARDIRASGTTWWWWW